VLNSCCSGRSKLSRHPEMGLCRGQKRCGGGDENSRRAIGISGTAIYFRRKKHQKRSRTKRQRRVPHLSFSGISSIAEGMFFPGSGQAGHSTASSPSPVVMIPLGMDPRPARFIIFRCRHSRTMTMKAW